MKIKHGFFPPNDECLRLIQRYHNGDENALNTLFQLIIPEIQRRVRNWIRTQDISSTEDVAQEICMKIIGVVRNKPFELWTNFTGYLGMTTKNMTLNFLVEAKKLSRIENIGSDYDFTQSIAKKSSHTEHWLTKNIRKEDLRKLHTAVSSLPEAQRLALKTMYLGKTYKTNIETAEILNRSIGTIKSSVHYGKKVLRKKIKKGEIVIY